MSFSCGVVKSDMGGCFHYRILQPFNELRRFGVEWRTTPFLPNNLHEPQLDTLVRWVEQFDLVVIQRCFMLEIFNRVKTACAIAGRPLLFETDDDYINLDTYNPCYPELNKDGVLDGFKEILRQADHITVSTQELKDIYYPYNTNIKVLPNNIEHINMFRDEHMQNIGADGKVQINELFGFCTYPSYVQFPSPEGTRVEKLFRVGYTATPTHRVDYQETIRPYLEKFLKKFPNTTMIYQGDPWFPQVGHPPEHKNVIFIPNQPHDLYMQNMRNYDVGIAPLMPTIFNMSKSPLKLLEYATWGIPAVAPNFITYNREFKHGENAMLYQNGREFYEMMCHLAENHEETKRLGLNAARHVHENRTEKVNAQERYDFYKSIIEGSPRPLRFIPNQEKEVATTP